MEVGLRLEKVVGLGFAFALVRVLVLVLVRVWAFLLAFRLVLDFIVDHSTRTGRFVIASV